MKKISLCCLGSYTHSKQPGEMGASCWPGLGQMLNLDPKKWVCPIRTIWIVVEGDFFGTYENNTDSSSNWRKMDRSKRGLFCFRTQLGILQYSSLFLLMCIYFWETGDTQCGSGGGAERGRPRIWSRLQALSCPHRAWRGAQTQEPWDHDLNQSWTLNRLSHPGAPTVQFWR